jgi:hypothetical protein
LLLPAVMILPAVGTWIGAGLALLPAIVVRLAMGGVAGWLTEREGATRRLADGRLWLRGERWSFAQIVLILGFHYSLAVAAAINPALGGDLFREPPPING